MPLELSDLGGGEAANRERRSGLQQQEEPVQPASS